MVGRLESARLPLTWLDTHAAIWLCTCDVPLSDAALGEIETAELRISPMVLLEMQFLLEIGRLNATPRDSLAILRRDFDLSVCKLPFEDVTEASHSETWTRDPFDRLIVAQAKLGQGKLIMKDRMIQQHFAGALW